MAKNRIPDPLSRRHLLEQDLAPARALALAEAYLAEGRSFEALDFLAKAEARERIEEIRAEAMAGGDVFLVREASQRLGEELDAARWRQLAEVARAAGKSTYADEAQRMADALA